MGVFFGSTSFLALYLPMGTVIVYQYRQLLFISSKMFIVLLQWHKK